MEDRGRETRTWWNLGPSPCSNLRWEEQAASPRCRCMENTVRRQRGQQRGGDSARARADKTKAAQSIDSEFRVGG
jgi:hypothetical protein